MINYDNLELLYPDKNKKIIFLFETFLEKINYSDTSKLKNKDLDSLRVVREYLAAADFTMCETIDASTTVSGNYYQHRHGLYLRWRDMNRSYTDVAKLICMLCCGELNPNDGSCLIEMSKDIYVGVGIDAKMHERIDKVKVFDSIAEMWGLFMGYESKRVRNVCFGDVQLALPFMNEVTEPSDVVAYYTKLHLEDLDVPLANEIIESWCDSESSLVNFVLLTTQPLYSQTMQNDGLIGSFVAKQDMGKSLYTEMLSKCYRKVANFSHKGLSDKGYLYLDLMAGIVTKGKDFAVFQETDGITTSAMASLKPLVTYTDKIPARFFSGKTFESAYHGSIVLTSNYVNKLDATGDVKKRMVNIKFRYSPIVRKHAAWLRTPVGATSVLLACLYKRGAMMESGYIEAGELKRDVSVTIADSVADTGNALMLKSYFDEKGFVTGKEMSQLFDNPRGQQLENILRDYGLCRVRRGSGVCYKPNNDTDIFETVAATALSGNFLVAFPLIKFSLDNNQNNEFITFDPASPDDLILDLDESSYNTWTIDKEAFKQLPNVKHIVSETANQLTLTAAATYNRMILDYDNLPKNATFEQIRDELTAAMGGVWFALWETARSTFVGLRVRVMIMMAKPMPVETWNVVAAEIDKVVGGVHDSLCSPIHKQSLIIPWMKYHFNVKPVGWQPDIDIAACVESEVKRLQENRNGGIPTSPPPDFKTLKDAFISHVETMSDRLDEYDFWMHTYLMPLSRYVVYDKSITADQAYELIQLTTDNFGEQMNNRKLLKDALRRRAGLDLFEQYPISIYEFYTVDGRDYSADGFEFPEAGE